MNYRPDPWTVYVAEFDEFMQTWTRQRQVDPIILAARLDQEALALRKSGRLSVPPQAPGTRNMPAVVRQLKGVATTDDALPRLAEFLQSGLDRGLATNSIAAYSEQVSVRLLEQWH